MKVLRSNYSCIEAALLWYEIYAEVSLKLVFVINMYDFCVENGIINVKQFTLAWHVNNDKLSHADKNFVTEVIAEIEI